MVPKILLADDSATIKKVIKFSLGSQMYEVVDADSEEEMMEKVSSLKPTLVLLDFTLSDTKSGYNLAKEIKAASPQSAILMLFGTFDTINEQALRDSSVDDRIVKPFDTTKFVNICKSLIDDNMDNDFNVQQTDDGKVLDLGEEGEEKEKGVDVFEPVGESTESFDVQSMKEDDPGAEEVVEDWVVDSAGNDQEEQEDLASFTNQETGKTKPSLPVNSLDDELKDWGVTVPPKMGEKETKSTHVEVPPIIEGGEDYTSVESRILGQQSTSSHLIPSEDLTGSNEIELSDPLPSEEMPEIGEETDPVINYENSTLQSAIADEIGEDNLWASDDPSGEAFGGPLDENEASAEQVDETPKRRKSDQPDENIGETTGPLNIGSDFGLGSLDESSTSSSAHDDFFEKTDEYQVQADDFRAGIDERPIDATEESVGGAAAPDPEQIEALLRPLIENAVKDYCKTVLENVAWEVIPDLAENIIKQELDKISSSVVAESDR